MTKIDFAQAITAEAKAAQAAEAMQKQLTATVDRHIEATAKARGYNSAASLASYVPSTNAAWAAEAGAFVAWRDAVWAHAIAALEDVQAGTRAVPDAAELIAELPEIAWP